MELPLIYNGTPPDERLDRARAALKQVDLEGRMSHKPNELSGGQRQRVAVAASRPHSGRRSDSCHRLGDGSAKRAG